MISQTDKGPDVIVEMLADVNLDKDLELAALSGRIAVSACSFAVHSITLYFLCQTMLLAKNLRCCIKPVLIIPYTLLHVNRS